MEKFKIGTPVAVLDEGLLMLQTFAPKDSIPNNIGQVASKEENGDYEIWFPVDGDLTYEHSQSSFYHRSQLRIRELLEGEKTINP